MYDDNKHLTSKQLILLQVVKITQYFFAGNYFFKKLMKNPENINIGNVLDEIANV